MTIAITNELKPFSKVSPEAFLSTPSNFLIVGDELLVLGATPVKVKKPTVLPLSSAKTVPAHTVIEYQQMCERANELGRRSIAEFTLRKSALMKLRKLGSKLHSTHVRFFTDAQRGIVARLFDVRLRSDLLLPRNKRIYAAATIGVSELRRREFSVTLSVDTLLMLTVDDILVSVYDDGILEAQPVNAKSRYVYMCRDQGVFEPYTSFVHETLGQTVYFVAHPSD